MSALIAIVEDEPIIAANYQELLQRHGYEVVVYKDRPSAHIGLAETRPALVILDIGLPGDPEGGFDLCRDLRAHRPQLPIMFLTARDSEIDVVSGLRLGADDYVTKDISPTHLMARVTALLRRVQAFQQAQNQDTLVRGDLTLDIDRLSTLWRDHHVPLTYTEFCMVHALVKHPGHVKSRSQLMDAAQVVLDDNTITSHVRRIRKKFEEVDSEFNHIETAYGVGYRWQLHP